VCTGTIGVFDMHVCLRRVCAQGERLEIRELKQKEGQTSPPGYLTEAELIEIMEKKGTRRCGSHQHFGDSSSVCVCVCMCVWWWMLAGIGTDASIPGHINNICTRNYVTIESGRTLKPTNLGIVLVHGYKKIDPDLVLPKVCTG